MTAVENHTDQNLTYLHDTGDSYTDCMETAPCRSRKMRSKQRTHQRNLVTSRRLVSCNKPLSRPVSRRRIGNVARDNNGNSNCVSFPFYAVLLELPVQRSRSLGCEPGNNSRALRRLLHALSVSSQHQQTPSRFQRRISHMVAEKWLSWIQFVELY